MRTNNFLGNSMANIWMSVDRSMVYGLLYNSFSIFIYSVCIDLFLLEQALCAAELAEGQAR